MAYAAVDTWNVVPDSFPATVADYRRNIRTPWSGSLVQRRQTYSSESAQGQAGIRKFTLVWANATHAQYLRAVALWDVSTGGSQGLSYLPTNLAYGVAETLIVRMTGAPFAVRQVGHNRYAFTVVLEEMLHAP